MDGRLLERRRMRNLDGLGHERHSQFQTNGFRHAGAHGNSHASPDPDARTHCHSHTYAYTVATGGNTAANGHTDADAHASVDTGGEQRAYRLLFEF